MSTNLLSLLQKIVVNVDNLRQSGRAQTLATDSPAHTTSLHLSLTKLLQTEAYKEWSKCVTFIKWSRLHWSLTETPSAVKPVHWTADDLKAAAFDG